jgi:iron complex outermembrane receptor protein
MIFRCQSLDKRLSRVRNAAMFTAFTAATVAGGAAHAQTAAPSQTAASDQLEAIVVTAEKRSENVQRVPIAITAFTGQDLEQRGVVDIHSLSNMTANVNLDAGSPFSGTSSVLAASIRGIGQDDFALNLDPGVGVYIDGVYLARTVGANQNLLDVERVEILKGPQGTLFGRNTIGGAISIVTHTPGDHFAGKVEMTTGSYARRDLAGTFDIPIADNLLSSITVSSLVRDGYQKRIPTPGLPDFNNIPETTYHQAGYFSNGDTQGGQNQQVVRAKLLYLPSDSLKFTFTGDWTHENQTAMANTVLATTQPPAGQLPANSSQGFLVALYNLCTSFASAAQAGAFTLGGSPLFGSAATLPNICGPVGPGLVAGPNGLVTPGPALYGRGIPQYTAAVAVTGNIDTTYATGNNFAQLDAGGFSLTGDWTLSNTMSLKSISGWRTLNWRIGMDNDGSALVVLEPSFREGQHQFSQEFQLIGSAIDNRLDYVLGAYYFREAGHVHDFVALDILMVDGDNTINTKSYAGFAHANFKVTDKFVVTAGARYSIENKEMIGRQSDPGAFEEKIATAGGCYPIVATSPCITSQFPDPNNPTLLFPPGVNKQTFDEFTPTLQLQYNLTEDLMAYVGYSKGFKSGGWTTRVPNPILSATLAEFKPERADTFEVGVKSQLLDDHLRLNLAAFDTLYKDIQLNEQEGPAPFLKNAGTARILGTELEAAWAVAHGFTIQSAIGYMNAHYTSTLPDTLIPLNTPLPKTPKWKASLGPQYTIDFEGDRSMRFVANYTFTSRMTNDTLATPLLTRPNTKILDLSVAYATAGGKYEIVLGGTNVTDKRYVITGQDQVAGGQVQATFNAPAEWYLQLRVKL